MELERVEERSGKGTPFFEQWTQSMPDLTGVGLPGGDEAVDASAYEWYEHARPSQQWPEGAWRIWLIRSSS